jgi:tetratricopeptide (TPR) repeat protein
MASLAKRLRPQNTSQAAARSSRPKIVSASKISSSASKAATAKKRAAKLSQAKAKKSPVPKEKAAVSRNPIRSRPRKVAARKLVISKKNAPAKRGGRKPQKSLQAKTQKLAAAKKKAAIRSKTKAMAKSSRLARPKAPPKPGPKVSKKAISKHTVSPAPPPAPARRQVSEAVLRAFTHAVKVFNRRQFAEAKPLFESLQARYPDELEIIARAQTYIQVCNQKLARPPASPRTADDLYDRGVMALNIGDFTQARQFFEKALRLRPDEPHLLYSLAVTHAQTGSHDQALDYLGRSIKIQPRFRTQAMNDSDFSGLREDKRFLELLGITSPFDLLESKH